MISVAETATYRIAPQFRRCLWYALIGIPVLVGASWYVSVVWQPLLARNFPVQLAILLAVAAAAVVGLRWRLIMDEHGLTRRRCGIQDIWTWDELASGAVDKGDSSTLVDRRRPWWRRRLTLDLLTENDRRAVLERVNAVYRFPNAPPLPESLEVRYVFGRCTIFDARGIMLKTKHDLEFTSWDDVERIHFWQRDLNSRLFHRLQIDLPDGEIRMQFHGGKIVGSFSGVSTETVFRFIEQFAPTERVFADQIGEQPAHKIEALRELAETKKRRRELLSHLAIFCPIYVGAIVWLAIDRPLAAIAMVLMSLFYPGSIIFYVLRRNAECRRLEQRIAEYDENGDLAESAVRG